MALVNSAFTVNVTPGAMPPVVHVSEYDVGRTYTVTINGENGSAFNIPNGTTATIEGTLNGSVGFTQSATISNNQVSFALSESMTAYSGKAWCKIKLSLNDEPIQTCAFVLDVDRAGRNVSVPIDNVVVLPLTVTENGAYTAAEGVAYSPVTVNVPQGSGGFDNTVDSFDQRNSAVAAYMDEVNYNGVATNVTEIYDYATNITLNSGLDDSVSHSVPVSESGSLFFTDEETGDAWKTSAFSPSYSVYNLVPTHTYTTLLKKANGDTISQKRLLPTGSLRMIHLFGKNHNFRDLGGWVCDGGAVRYGLLYRGAELSGKYTTATADDLSMVRDRLFVRNEVDLRSDSDTDGGTPSDPSDDIVSSVLGDDVYYQRYAMAEYADGINLSGAGYPVVVNALKNIMTAVVHGTVTYFHCIYGADRTGTIAFLLEAMLGMSQSCIDKDYELSSFSFLYTGAQINRAATRYRGLCDYIGTMGKSNLRNNVIQWAVRAGITVAEINAFRKAIINGNPSTIQESDFVIYYTVSQNLTNCTSNHSGSVRENNALTAKLTASEGYTMTGATVTVTMGGTNITASAYDGAGNISIPSVTGNVVITASAAEIIDANYVTMVDGVKLDKANGSAGSASNYAANDFFAVQSGATYKITSDSTGITSCGICYYDSSNRFVSYASIWDTGAVSTEYTLSVPSNAAYFRLRLYYQGQTNLATVAASMSMTEQVSGDTTDYLFNHT